MWKYSTWILQLSLVYILIHGVLFVLLTASHLGFWQYGTVRWDEFHRYLISFVFTHEPWTIFHYDPTQQLRGVPCPSSAEVVQPGHYILLSSGENWKSFPGIVNNLVYSRRVYCYRPPQRSTTSPCSHNFYCLCPSEWIRQLSRRIGWILTGISLPYPRKG